MIAVKTPGAEVDADAVERADLGFAAAVDLGDVDGAGDRGLGRRRGGREAVAVTGVASPGRFDRGAIDRAGPRSLRGVGLRTPTAKRPRRPSSSGSGRTTGVPCVRSQRNHAERDQEHDDAHPRVDPQRSDGVRRIDAHLLEHEARRGVAHAVQREQLELLQLERVVDPDRARGRARGSRATRTGTSAGTSRTAGSSSGRFARSISSAHGNVVGPPNSSWLNQLPQRPIACANSEAGRDAVEQVAEVEVPAPGEDDRGERAADHRAPDAEAALPDLERLEPVVLNSW